MRVRALRLTTAGLFAVFVAVAAALSALFVGSAFSHPGLTDFAAFYALGRQVVEHGAGSVYSLELQRQAFDEVGVRFWYPDMYPPELSYLMAPLTVLPLRAALAAWLLLSAAALVASWALAASGAGWARALQLAWALSLVPVQFAFFHGQVVLLVGAAVAAAWWLLRRDHDLLAGAVLAAIVVKPQLAFAVPVALAVAGRWRAAGAFVLVATAVTLLSFAATAPSGGPAAYLEHLRGGLDSPQAFGVASQLSLTGLVRSAVVAQPAAVLLTVLVPAILLGVLGIAVRRSPRRLDVAVAGGLLTSLLATPFLHVQDLAILPVGAWVMARAAPARVPVLAAGSWAVLQASSADGGAWLFPLVGGALLAGAAAFPRRRAGVQVSAGQAKAIEPA